MNKNQISGRIKYVVGVLQEEIGRLVGSIRQQIKGIELQFKGRAQINRGDEGALAEVVRFDQETAKRRTVWVSSRG